MVTVEAKYRGSDAIYKQYAIEQAKAKVLSDENLNPIEDPLEGAIGKYNMLIRLGDSVQEKYGDEKLRIDFSNIKPKPKNLRECIAQRLEPVTAVFFFNGELYNWVLNGQYDVNSSHFDLSNVLITPESLKYAWERPIKSRGLVDYLNGLSVEDVFERVSYQYS